MGLAAVHQQLYQATDLTAVRCDELLREIATNISETSGTPTPLTVEFDMTPVLLEPDQAIPLSLFATECVMNAVKHSGDAGGKVQISLAQVEDGAIRLSVANTVDAGSAGENLKVGIGSQLIEAFCRQLKGEVQIESSDDRHSISLIFSPDAPR